MTARVCRDCEFWEERPNDLTLEDGGHCHGTFRVWQPDPENDPDDVRRDTLVLVSGSALACRHWNELRRQDARDVAMMAAQMFSARVAEPGVLFGDVDTEIMVEIARQMLRDAFRPGWAQEDEA